MLIRVLITVLNLNLQTLIIENIYINVGFNIVY
jgi:hypothetical protein